MKKRKWYWWLGLWIVIGWVVYFLALMKVFGLFYEIWKNPSRGIPYTVGSFLCLGIGLWLMGRGRSRVSKNLSKGKVTSTSEIPSWGSDKTGKKENEINQD